MSSLINYGLLDGAILGQLIEEAKILNQNHQSLYLGRSEEDLASVAPYLFSFSSNNKFTSWLSELVNKESCAVLLLSERPFEEIFKHFRKFLMIKTEDGQQLYFRFYDPRVLKIFLPTCDNKQIIEFFGPVESFIVEGESKEEAICYWHENGILKQKTMPIEQVFGNVIETNIEN